MKYLLFAFVLLVFSYSSCDHLGKEEKCERDYSFSIPVTLSPALDTFHIGDTIHISMEFPSEMEDENSGESFNMSDFPFNTQLSIARIDTTSASCSNTLVTYIEKEGSLNFFPLSFGCLIVQVDYLRKENKLIFSADIVLESVGMFAFGSNSQFLDRYKLPIQELCKTNSVQIHYNLTPIGANANFNFLPYSVDDLYKEFTLKEFNKSSGFVFFVIK